MYGPIDVQTKNIFANHLKRVKIKFTKLRNNCVSKYNFIPRRFVSAYDPKKILTLHYFKKLNMII